MKEILISLFSGIIGVMLTIGYQHFFSASQSFTFIYNGEEMIVTQSDYAELVEQNEKLESENNTYISDLDEANKKISELQSQIYNEDFQNVSLILNGIDSGYKDKVVIINNETFYSQGFLQYIAANQAISIEHSKLFADNVKTEEEMPISLFELKPFTAGYSLEQVTNEEDNYGNIFPEAFKVKSDDCDYEGLMNRATEYFIDKNYSTLRFDVAYSKNAAQNTDYEVLIYGDGILLKSVLLNRKTKVHNVEVDISNVEFLQIVGKCKSLWGYGECYSLIFNTYLYP